MTAHLSDDAFDREIRRFLAVQAEDVGGAPSTAEVAARISARVNARRGLVLRPQLAWVVVAGLLIAALVGALVAGRAFPRSIGARPYEAVFLRLDVVDSRSDVTVVAVDRHGHERQVARLAGTWDAYKIGSEAYLPPVGAVSTTGLLALPNGNGQSNMHWEIFDLHRPASAPIVLAGMEQFIEQLREQPYFRVDPRGGAFWGPGERLAILWYSCSGSCEVHLQASFVEGRTGATVAVAVPKDQAVLPYWAADGSGIYVADAFRRAGSAAYRVTDEGDFELRNLLRADGTVVDAGSTVPEPSCRKRDRTGARVAPIPASLEMDTTCLAPDDSMIVVQHPGATNRGARLIDAGTGTGFDVSGSFAGFLQADDQ